MFVRTVPIHPLGRKLHDKVDEEEAADVDSRQHIVYADEAMLSNLWMLVSQEVLCLFSGWKFYTQKNILKLEYIHHVGLMVLFILNVV